MSSAAKIEQKPILVSSIAILAIKDEAMDVNRLPNKCSLLVTLTLNQEWTKGCVVFLFRAINETIVSTDKVLLML